MSAIYGVVYNKSEGAEKILSKMQEGYENCKIDRFSNVIIGRVGMGCGIQHIVPEAEKEVLPSEDENYIYTVDAILDNRQELCGKLQIPLSSPDGFVLYKSFLKWGKEMYKHVYGIYSACFYNRNDNVTYLITDPTSSRCVNYYVCEDGFYFSTIIKPIIKGSEYKIQVSEKWISMCESNCSADLILEPELTAFEGVYQLEAGCMLVYANKKTEKIKYYEPKNHVKKLKVTDEKGMEMFRETFFKCVADVLRSNGETGVTLSSGLDSSSVACVASKALMRKHKKLKSYTSVPIKGYTNDEDPFLVVDEEEGVRRLGKYYPDIQMTFVDCPKKNAFSDLKSLIDTLECPYKSGVNLVWLDEIYRIASQEDDCKIILKGQYGNSTISYGTLMTTVYQSVKGAHFATAYKEIDRFGKKNKIGRKNVCKVIMKAYKENRISKEADPCREAFTKKELLDKHHVTDVIRGISERECNCWVDKQSERLNTIFSSRIFAHLGAFDTKLGLKYGIVVRDPSKDVRILELCMALPITCFSGNGFERRLIREGMRGIVPDCILDDTKHRGWQGADFEYRLNNNWDDIKDYALNLLTNPKIRKYLDMKKVTALRRSILDSENILDNKDTRWAVKLLVVDALSEFLIQWSENVSGESDFDDAYFEASDRQAAIDKANSIRKAEIKAEADRVAQVQAEAEKNAKIKEEAEKALERALKAEAERAARIKEEAEIALEKALKAVEDFEKKQAGESQEENQEDEINGGRLEGEELLAEETEPETENPEIEELLAEETEPETENPEIEELLAEETEPETEILEDTLLSEELDNDQAENSENLDVQNKCDSEIEELDSDDAETEFTKEQNKDAEEITKPRTQIIMEPNFELLRQFEEKHASKTQIMGAVEEIPEIEGVGDLVSEILAEEEKKAQVEEISKFNVPEIIFNENNKNEIEKAVAAETENSETATSESKFSESEPQNSEELELDTESEPQNSEELELDTDAEPQNLEELELDTDAKQQNSEVLESEAFESASETIELDIESSEPERLDQKDIESEDVESEIELREIKENEAFEEQENGEIFEEEELVGSQMAALPDDWFEEDYDITKEAETSIEEDYSEDISELPLAEEYQQAIVMESNCAESQESETEMIEVSVQDQGILEAEAFEEEVSDQEILVSESEILEAKVVERKKNETDYLKVEGIESEVQETIKTEVPQDTLVLPAIDISEFVLSDDESKQDIQNVIVQDIILEKTQSEEVNMSELSGSEEIKVTKSEGKQETKRGFGFFKSSRREKKEKNAKKSKEKPSAADLIVEFNIEDDKFEDIKENKKIRKQNADKESDKQSKSSKNKKDKKSKSDVDDKIVWLDL